MQYFVKLLTALALSTCALNCTAFVPLSYSKEITVHFEEGKFEIADREQTRLMKLIEHWDDFVAVNVFVVLAHGDEVSNDVNKDIQAELARARADAIKSFYTEHAPLQLRERLHTYTEPIKKDGQADETGRAEVVIQGFCKPENFSICGDDWPPQRPIDRE
ncbi:hypothetical protein SAMN05443245_7577 [Paraburkholderia fungorum]|uniref:OmpA-like domain-containing protein n=1 Tax=Paraburkholderia fungorum TaxID=134537 RepID=A0A1H1JZH8_9BURK|nr:hypothetical protein [Paraburkholderia fungorum]SDR55047.1 hypothetical protein SAMN05443245_7577 [Paraburkholderia fungorum]